MRHIKVRAYEGTRVMRADQCRARYSKWHPFRCDELRGHTGGHIDRTADAPSIIEWRAFSDGS